MVFSPMLDPKAVEVLLSNGASVLQSVLIMLQAVWFQLFYFPAEKVRMRLKVFFASRLNEFLPLELFLANLSSFCRGKTEKQGLLL